MSKPKSILTYRLCGYKSGLPFKDLLFIAYAGMIRGAVAFGLVLQLDDSFANREVIITTTLSLVIVSTVLMGSTVSSVQRLLFGNLSKKVVPVYSDNKLKPAASMSSTSHHEIFLHPNYELNT